MLLAAGLCAAAAGTEERMTRSPEALAAERAQALMAGGGPSTLVRREGKVAEAIAIRTPDGTLHSWFVAVTVNDRIVGFFQLLPDLTPIRWSTFQRREDSLAACPPAAHWLDRAAIRDRAAALAGGDETAGPPALSYDRVPDRIAWAVPLVSADGATRTVFVAGAAVWPAGPVPPTARDHR